MLSGKGCAMKATIRSLAVLIAILVLPAHSFAQTDNKRLEGIGSVNIIVEGLHDGARPCGVTIDALRSAASFPIVTSRLLMSKTSAITFYVQVSVLSQDSGCTAAYEIEVYANQNVVVTESNLRKFVEVELWEQDGLMVGPRGDFGRRMTDVIDRLAKQFVVDWTLDQQ